MTDNQQTEQLKEALNKYARAYGKSFETVYGEYIVARTLIDFGMLPLLLPENAVVLTREEFDRLNSCIKSEEEVRAIMQQQMLPMVRELTDKEVGTKLGTVAALVRKATANEFYDKINENICSFKLENKSQEFIVGYAQAIADICGRLDQVAKQFGVEVDK